MNQETSSSWPGSIDEVTFTLFTMFLYMLLDIMLLTFLMAYRQNNEGLTIPTDSGQIMSAFIFSWGAGWSGAVLRMNGVCNGRLYMSRDAADTEAFKSMALGALLQLPLFALMIAFILA